MYHAQVIHPAMRVGIQISRLTLRTSMNHPVMLIWGMPAAIRIGATSDRLLDEMTSFAARPGKQENRNRTWSAPGWFHETSVATSHAVGTPTRKNQGVFVAVSLGGIRTP